MNTSVNGSLHPDQNDPQRNSRRSDQVSFNSPEGAVCVLPILGGFDMGPKAANRLFQSRPIAAIETRAGKESALVVPLAMDKQVIFQFILRDLGILWNPHV